MRDLVVAGGGPVGLAAALHAVRAGLDVVVYEPRSGVIDKACGEGLMPGALAALAALDVAPAGQTLRGIRYRSENAHAEADFRHGTGLGVRRTTLHDALRERVDDAGIPVVAERVEQVINRDRSVLVNGVPARYLVAADGLHSPTRRMLGLEVPGRAARRFGLRRHVEIAPWTDFVEVHWSPTAEAYVTPVAEGLVGVAVLTRRRGSFDEHLRTFPWLEARLAGAVCGPVLGAGPLRQRSRRRVCGRVLLLGDASGYVDALTGEGIALGLAQAEAAVAAVAGDDPDGYERAWRTLTWRYEAVTRALLGVSAVPATRAALVPLAAALPRVFAAAVNEVARPVGLGLTRLSP